MKPKKIQSTQDFITVKVTSEIFQDAQNRNNLFFNKFGNLGSHRTNDPKQRLVGYLAEAAIKSTFKNFEYSEDFKVDFIAWGKTWDSKAQISTSCFCYHRWLWNFCPTRKTRSLVLVS